MKKFYLLLVVCFFSLHLLAQNTFQALYGNTDNSAFFGSTATAVVQTGDGGYAFTGTTYDYATGNFYLLKTNVTGAVAWYKNYAVTDVDKKATEISALEKTSDGGFIIAGSAYGVFGNNDVLIMKTDSLGNVQWHRVFGSNGNSAAKAIRQTPTGEYIVLGTADDLGNAAAFMPGLYALKLSATGDSLWTKTYDYTGSDHFNAANVQVTSDGNYVLGGTAFTGNTINVTDRIPVLIKVNAANGNIIWSKSFGSPALEPFYEELNDFEIAADGGFILTGTSAVKYGYVDGLIMKTDADGNTIQWAKRYALSDTSANEDFNSLAATANGFTIYGDFFSYQTSKQFTLAVSTDNNGNINWANRLGNGNFNYGLSAIATQDNSFVFGGYEVADFNFEATTAYVIKADANGTAGCYQSPLDFTVSNASFSIGAGPTAYAGGGGVGGETVTAFSDSIPVTVLCQNPPPQLQFTYFSGKKSGSKNTLSWRTKSEVKSDKYYIQRSVNKNAITTLAEVDATYKTLSNQTYNYNDARPGAGTNYYRIKAVNKNGRTTYSKVIAIANNNIVVNNTTTPGVVLFQSQGAFDTDIPYSIYSALGNKVYDGNLKNNGGKIFSLVNLSSLKDGIYFVKMNTTDNVMMQQIIISH